MQDTVILAISLVGSFVTIGRFLYDYKKSIKKKNICCCQSSVDIVEGEAVTFVPTTTSFDQTDSPHSYSKITQTAPEHTPYSIIFTQNTTCPRSRYPHNPPHSQSKMGHNSIADNEQHGLGTKLTRGRTL